MPYQPGWHKDPHTEMYAFNPNWRRMRERYTEHHPTPEPRYMRDYRDEDGRLHEGLATQVEKGTCKWGKDLHTASRAWQNAFREWKRDLHEWQVHHEIPRVMRNWLPDELKAAINGEWDKWEVVALGEQSTGPYTWHRRAPAGRKWDWDTHTWVGGTQAHS